MTVCVCVHALDAKVSSKRLHTQTQVYVSVCMANDEGCLRTTCVRPRIVASAQGTRRRITITTRTGGLLTSDVVQTLFLRPPHPFRPLTAAAPGHVHPTPGAAAATADTAAPAGNVEILPFFIIFLYIVYTRRPSPVIDRAVLAMDGREWAGGGGFIRLTEDLAEPER